MKRIIPYYFRLQYTRFSRWCSELQILPLIVIIILAIAFSSASTFLFYKTELAKWVYPAIGLVLLVQVSKTSTLNSLQSIFTEADFRLIKVVQSILFAIPFSVFLFIKGLPLQGALLLVLAIAAGLINYRPSANFKVGTPFYKWPFEFVVGFRKTFILVGILYFLVFKGIQVGNENLAYASLGFIFLLSVSFYSYPENEIFVWINHSNPATFLQKKIRIAYFCSSLLAFPMLMACLIAFPSYYLAAIFIFLVGYLLLTMAILAKYSTFPQELGLPQAIILGISFMFPPLLIYTLPNFYKKAKKNLEPILQC